MNVTQLAQALQLQIIAGGEGRDREITGVYCGDLLSWVMGRAKSGDAWITVMGNVNAIAVASLADTACIILSEDSEFDDQAKIKADGQDIPVMKSSLTTYELAVQLARQLQL